MRKNNKHGTSRIRVTVKENIDRMEKVQLSEVVEIIRPLYTFVPEELVEKELKNKARYIIRSLKDDDGVGVFFSNSRGVYINTDLSANFEELTKVEAQLSVKYSGINSSMKKVRRKIKKIMPGIKFKRG